MAILYQGAEAIISLERGGEGPFILKKRISKGYRIRELDEKIRKQRTRLESSLLSKAKRFGIHVPRVLEQGEFEIKMEFIDGKRVKDSLEKMDKNERKLLYEKMGEAVASLHTAGIMHGDLTTSNMIVQEGKNPLLPPYHPSNLKLYLIDFGLARSSSRVEDQAADLFLLYEALKAGHFTLLEEAWDTLLNVYKRKYSNALQVMEQFRKIQLRRRYKSEV